MANQISALKWLNEIKLRGELSVRQYTWPERYGLSFFDHEISMCLDGKNYRGRGKDSDEFQSVLKAAAECVERAHCGWNGVSSSGVAAHLNEQAAKENARRELSEHDVFFCHLLSETIPSRLNFNFESSPMFKPFLDAEVAFEAYGEPSEFILVLAVCRNQVVSLGMSYGEQNIQRALNECLPNAMNYIVNGVAGFDRLTAWRQKALVSPNRNLKAPSDTVDFEFLSAPLNCPFVVVRATSPAFQKYLRAGWQSEDINLERLTGLDLVASNLLIGEKFF